MYVGTATTILRLARTGIGQTPATVLTFGGVAPARTSAKALALFDGKLVVAHEGILNPFSGSGGGVLGYYTLTGETLATRVTDAPPSDVAVAGGRLFWTQAGRVDRTTAADLIGGAAPATALPEAVAANICVSAGRLYFLAPRSSTGAHEVRYVPAD